MISHKKMYLLLLILSGVMLVFLGQQIVTARKITTRNQPLPLISPVMVQIPTDGREPLLGNPGAPLTIIGFMDLTDKKSKKYYLAIRDFVKHNPTKARFIWKDLAIEGVFHKPVVWHVAAYCANQQQKFWPFVDVLMDQVSLRESRLPALAEQARLNLAAWENCRELPEAAEAIAMERRQAGELYLPSAPAIFVNNKLVNLEEDVEMKGLLTSLIAE